MSFTCTKSVKTAYNSLNLDESQPVKKVRLNIYRVRHQLLIDPVDDDQLVAGGGGLVHGAAHGGMAAEEALQTMTLQFSQFCNEVNQRFAAESAEIQESRNFMKKQFKVLNNNIRCYSGTIEGSLVRRRTRRCK